MQATSSPRPTRLLPAALALLSLALVAALWWFTEDLGRREEALAVGQQAAANENLVLAHERQLTALLQQFEQRLDALAREHARDGAATDVAAVTGWGQPDAPHLISASVLDANGNVAVSAPTTMASVNYADRAYFAHHRDRPGSDMVVEAPVLGRATGRWLITLSKRLDDPSGRFAGVAVMGVDPAYFTRLYESTNLGQAGSLAMIGLDGITRARRNGAEVSYGQDVRRSQLFTELGRAAQGHYVAKAASDGVLRIVAYRRFADHPLVAVVASGYEEAVHAARERAVLYRWFAAGGTALLGALLALGALQIRRDRGALNRIRDSELRYRLIHSHNRDAILRLKPDGTIVDTNPAARQVFGAGGSTLDGRRLAELLELGPGPDAAAMAGADASVEVPGRRLDGTPVHIELTTSRYTDERGEDAVLAVARDITLRRQLEQRQAQLQQIIDASPEFIGSSTMDGEITFLNAAARRMVGVGNDTPLPGFEAFHPKWACERIRDEGIPTAVRLGSWLGETALRMADGSERPVLQTIVCHRDAEGRPWQLSTVAQDLTAVKAAVAAQRETLVAQQASRAKSDFMSRMSHELRTPLNAILGFSELLQHIAAVATPVQTADNARHIHDAGQHLLALIDDLLDLSRLDAGTLRLNLGPVDAQAQARAAVAECAIAAAGRGVKLQVDVAPGEPAWAMGDATRLRQILLNLLSNAVKYGREGGTVRVTISRADAMLDVAVSDEGEGMTSAQLERLFTPFDRLGREQGRIQGVGIGLVISRGLAELMDGTLEATSQRGQGTTFRLRLPACDELPAARTEASAPAWPVLRPCRLLYVDDDATNREMMSRLVALQPQVVLQTAEDGEAALRAMRSAPPDVLLADIRMPGMDGFALLREVQSDPALAGLRCVAVSAHAMPEEIDAALAAGFRGYVVKPVSAQVLFDELARHLSAQAGA